MSDKNLLWLWTHCRAIGMKKKADASEVDPLAMDIALFTADQQAELDRLRRELAKARELLREVLRYPHKPGSAHSTWNQRAYAFLTPSPPAEGST